MSSLIDKKICYLEGCISGFKNNEYAKLGYIIVNENFNIKSKKGNPDFFGYITLKGIEGSFKVSLWKHEAVKTILSKNVEDDKVDL